MIVVAPQSDPFRQLIERWKSDPGATYQTWFRWDERLKNFRSIRRGIAAVVDEIERGVFGNTYKGSSLAIVVGAVAEQRQIFKGADHAFLWKPKLRIPDIYENPENQLAFGRFLDTCACCNTESQILAAIHGLAARQIKGLGPAAANLLYFLHPTLVTPCNTAIVAGYNALTGSRVKLGRWDEYLAMRKGILELNAKYRDLLSNDLGAFAGLLFDVGTGRYTAPPTNSTAKALGDWEKDLAAVREEASKSIKARAGADAGERTHTQVQAWLRDLGRDLGYSVWVASNDRNRPYAGGRLGDGCRATLPEQILSSPSADTVGLIDILWIEDASDTVAAAFEVEHTTSIYSGIVRMLDLALGFPKHAGVRLFLVAPDGREADVRAQLQRPAFNSVRELRVGFLPYGELEAHRQSMARFGQGLRPVEALSRQLV